MAPKDLAMVGNARLMVDRAPRTIDTVIAVGVLCALAALSGWVAWSQAGSARALPASGSPGAASGAAPAGQLVTIVVDGELAAAFADLGAAFSREHAGVSCRGVCADGQGALAEACRAWGADLDLFAAASEESAAAAVGDGGVGPAVAFATSRLCIAASTRSEIGEVCDLARPHVRIAIAEGTSPGAVRARSVVRKLAAGAQAGSDISRGLAANIALGSPDSASVAAQVESGAADAGLCCRPDAIARTNVRIVNIPDRLNEIATCSFGTVNGSAHGDQARELMRFVLSPDGQSILRAHGFSPRRTQLP
jgi:molybdate transport system substrate-binding protein